MQRALNDQWHIGLSFDDIEIDVGRDRLVSRVQHATGDGLQLGAVLKGKFGPSTLSTSISTGRTNFESERSGFRDISFTNATSDYGTDTFAAHIRYGYAIEAKQWYVRPMLDAGWTTISRGGFTEEGSGPTNLVVDAASEELVTLQPAIEIGGEVELPSGAKMRSWVRGGVTRLLSGENVSLAARFEGAPADVAPMKLSQSLDRRSTDLAIGLDVLNCEWGDTPTDVFAGGVRQRSD